MEITKRVLPVEGTGFSSLAISRFPSENLPRDEELGPRIRRARCVRNGSAQADPYGDATVVKRTAASNRNAGQISNEERSWSVAIPGGLGIAKSIVSSAKDWGSLRGSKQRSAAPRVRRSHECSLFAECRHPTENPCCPRGSRLLAAAPIHGILVRRCSSHRQRSRDDSDCRVQGTTRCPALL
jgi:hypothetical protein